MISLSDLISHIPNIHMAELYLSEHSSSVANGDGCPTAHFTCATLGSLAEPQPVIVVAAGLFPPTSDKLSVLLPLFADDMFLSQHKCYN